MELERTLYNRMLDWRKYALNPYRATLKTLMFSLMLLVPFVSFLRKLTVLPAFFNISIFSVWLVEFLMLTPIAVG